MENTPVRLPDCELEVMQVVWLLEKEGERYVTAGQIMKRYPPLCRYKSTTVLTLLDRLHMKGFLLTEKRSRNKYYAPGSTAIPIAVSSPGNISAVCTWTMPTGCARICRRSAWNSPSNDPLRQTHVMSRP